MSCKSRGWSPIIDGRKRRIDGPLGKFSVKDVGREKTKSWAQGSQFGKLFSSQTEFTMKLRCVRAWIFLVAVCLTTRIGSAQVIEFGYVLLNNDRCLDGRIEMVADRYVITKTEGNQVSAPRTQVQFVGSSKLELYEFKRRSIPPQARAGDHFKLAQWCLSMQLLAEAGQHYLKVIQTHPAQTHSSVKRLGAEIKEAMLQQAEFREHMGLSPLRPAAAKHALSAPPGEVAVAKASSDSAFEPFSAQFGGRLVESMQNPVVTADARMPVNPSGLRPVLPGAAQYQPVPAQAAAANFPVGEEVPTSEEIDALDEMVTRQLGFPPLTDRRNVHDPFDPAEFNRKRAASVSNRYPLQEPVLHWK